MSVSTPLRLASVSKVMTAALALRLESSGIISLDTPIVALVPEVEEWLHPGVTMRRCLNHTTGIPDYVDADNDRFMRTRGPLTDEFVLDEVAKKPPWFEPGAAWGYSSTGFYLVALALRRATGLSWDALIRDSLAAPLALESLRECDDYIGHDRLQGYETGDGTPVDAVLYAVTGIKGDGGLCATAGDVAAFARKLERESYLEPGVFDRMVTPTVLANGTPVDYGLGARLGSLGGHRLWGHTGSVIDAYVATVLRFPDDDVTVVVLLNTIDARTDALVIAWQLAEVALELPAADLRPVAALDRAPFVGDYIGWGEGTEPSRSRVAASAEEIRLERLDGDSSVVRLIPLGAESFGRADWPRDRIQFHAAAGVVTSYSEYYAGLFATY